MSKIPIIGKPIDKWRNMSPTVKASTSYAVCSILQRCISFFTMPFFLRSRFHLTTAQFGEVTLYSTWMGILTIFLTLNLASGSFATAMVKFEKDRNGYISAIQGINIFLVAVFLAIYIPFRNLFNVVFELPTPIVILMIVELSMNMAWSLWSGRNRFEFKWKAVVAASLINSIISPVLAILIVINVQERGFGRIAGFAAPVALIGLGFFILNFVRGKKFYNHEYWEYALRFNVPLIAYYLSQTVFNMSDRIMIDHLIGKDQAGIYGAAYSVAMVLTFVLSAINNSYVPWFYGQLKEGKSKENKSVAFAIALLMSVLLCGVIWFAPEVIYLWAGKDYMSAIYVVLPISVSLLLLFYSQLFINVEFFYERKKDLVWASIGAAIINIVLNYFLIPKFGIVAAGYTTLASYVVFAFCNYLAMKRILKQMNRKDDMYNYKSLIVLLLLLCGLSAAGVLLYDFLWARIAVAVIVLAVMIIKRNYFLDMYKQIKKK